MCSLKNSSTGAPVPSRAADRVTILAVDPGLERTPLTSAGVVRGELGHAEGVEPGGDRHRLFPVRELPPVAQVALLLESPLATTWYLAGAVTKNSLVALSYGWSIIGSHCRALSGQLSLKKVRSPYRFFPIRSPAEGCRDKPP